MLAHVVVGLSKFRVIYDSVGWIDTRLHNRFSCVSCLYFDCPARALRPLWLLLADVAPTVGRGENF